MKAFEIKGGFGLDALTLVERPDPRDPGHHPWTLEVGAAIGGSGLEEDIAAGLDVGACPDDVDHTGAVGADGAALVDAAADDRRPRKLRKS